jgi:GT2 family glycosyltransferase
MNSIKNHISVLVGLKNNLEYTKNFYYTTRELYPDVEIVFTSYNSTDGTHEWLNSLEDNNLIYYTSAEEKTFSDTFNKCTKLATREYVVYAHNDIVLTPGFMENMEKHIADQLIIYYTTIEPPIFSDDERPGKIIKDFGADVKTLDKSGLHQFSLKIQRQSKNMFIPDAGTSFFLCVNRQVLLNIGGLDPLYNPMFCEDDDLILRLRLSGLKTFTLLDAICYHFVSKTSRFSEEYQNRTAQIEANSNKNFVRKWGFKNSSPIKKKYDIGLAVQNGNENLLAKLEPLCSTIYIDTNATDYINKEQPNTSINLKNRIKPLDTIPNNDILITVDGNDVNEKAINKLQHINEVITRKINTPVNFFEKLFKPDRFDFKFSIFTIRILKSVTHEKQLINLTPQCFLHETK